MSHIRLSQIITPQNTWSSSFGTTQYVSTNSEQEKKIPYPDIETHYDNEKKILAYKIRGSILYNTQYVPVLLKQNLEMREKVIELEKRLADSEDGYNDLYYAPPGRGGPGYEEGRKRFRYDLEKS